MKKLIIPLLLALAVVGAPAVSLAADQPASPASEGKKDAKAKFRPFRGTIKTIDKSAKVITLDGEKAQTFQITSETKINKDKKPAILDDLATGDVVGGRARETGDGKWDALTINVSNKPVKEPANKGGGKKEKEEKK